MGILTHPPTPYKMSTLKLLDVHLKGLRQMSILAHLPTPYKISTLELLDVHLKPLRQITKEDYYMSTLKDLGNHSS